MLYRGKVGVCVFFFLDTCKTHKYIQNIELSNRTPVVTYSNHQTLKRVKHRDDFSLS